MDYVQVFEFAHTQNYDGEIMSFPFFECFSFIIDDDEVPLPRGGARRHGEQRHTKGSCCSKSLYFDIQKLLLKKIKILSC